MAKHAKKSEHLQIVDLPKTTTVEVPLPLLGAFASIERSFFDLCIDAGQQVLAAMMEQDREDLCGPAWKRDPGRKAGRAGTTQSEVTLGGRRIPMARPRVRSQEGRERLDQWLLKLPLLGPVVFKYEIAKFARTIGTLMGNGVSLLQSLSIAVDTVDNTQVKKALGVLEPAVKRGQRMSHALADTKAFTPMVVQIMRVGEESGSLDKMMTELADVYDEEVQTGVKRSLTLLEPILILVMGGAISVIIISVLMGIMSVNDLAL